MRAQAANAEAAALLNLILGAVLNTINTRLDAATIAFILDHGDSKAVITDTELSPMMKEALTLCKAKPIVIDVDDASTDASPAELDDSAADVPELRVLRFYFLALLVGELPLLRRFELFF